jgi:toxin CcdB
MAQFDVHANPGVRTREIPFVVVIQSRRLDRSKRRVVVPLVDRRIFSKIHEPRLNPTFVVSGQDVVFDPLQIVSVAVDALGPKIASLTENGDDIVAALDIVLARGFG